MWPTSKYRRHCIALHRTGMDPLLRYALHTELHTELRSQFLVKQGANKTAGNIYGKRPVHIYCGKYDCSDPENAATYKALQP